MAPDPRQAAAPPPASVAMPGTASGSSRREAPRRAALPFDALHLLPMRDETIRNLVPLAQQAGLQTAVGRPYLEVALGPLGKIADARAAKASAWQGRRVLILAEDSLFAPIAGRRLREQYRAMGCDARLIVYLGWDANAENRELHGRIVGGAASAMCRRHILDADGIVFVSRWVEQRYRAWLGDRITAPSTILSHGIDARFIADARGRPHERPQGSAGPPTRFVTVTNFEYKDKSRGVALLAEGLAGLPGSWTWRVLGDGVHRAANEQAAAALGDRAKFLGRLPHERVLAELDTADLFLYASFLDAQPRAVAEALARGLPVLVCRGSGAVEPVEATGAGLVVDATPEAVKAGLVGLRGNAALWASMRARAAAVDPDRFSWSQFLAGLAAFWPRVRRGA